MSLRTLLPNLLKGDQTQMSVIPLSNKPQASREKRQPPPLPPPLPPPQMYSSQENFNEIPRSTTHLHFLQNDFTILRGLQETSPPKSSLANAQKKSYKKRGEKVAGRRVSKRLMSRGKRQLKTQKLSKSCLPLWLWKKSIIPALMLSFNQ